MHLQLPAWSCKSAASVELIQLPSRAYDVHAAAILIGALEAGDVRMACQVVHDLYFPPDILHVLWRPVNSSAGPFTISN